MKRSFLRVAFALVAALLFAAGGHAETAKKPALQVTTLDGATFDLATQRGKWVIVNFWATWCSPCIKEMPDISQFVAARSDVAAIGLAFGGEEKQDVVAYLGKHPVKYPVANLPLEEPPKDFDAPKGLPTTYLIAPDGSVAKKFTGPVTSAELEKAIAAGANAEKS
ncbi:MAG TPA: TlpA disulfide reductase family protein [Rhodanobacteraceae bacterium]|jgi:thiol-disulfide isomerase/thioredoxin|nr:TlpA disulfide reductase family protein [Rhodanobacteraceae bacterium]